mmetsp:Transcript_28259/g.40987  ORF Transcript_28259/g.40987 Transcript_28259/m.40987 type:complete len:239 (-) Transcript_28259:1473-2189(-)
MRKMDVEVKRGIHRAMRIVVVVDTVIAMIVMIHPPPPLPVVENEEEKERNKSTAVEDPNHPLDVEGRKGEKKDADDPLPPPAAPPAAVAKVKNEIPKRAAVNQMPKKSKKSKMNASLKNYQNGEKHSKNEKNVEPNDARHVSRHVLDIPQKIIHSMIQIYMKHFPGKRGRKRIEVLLLLYNNNKRHIYQAMWKTYKIQNRDDRDKKKHLKKLTKFENVGVIVNFILKKWNVYERKKVV